MRTMARNEFDALRTGSVCVHGVTQLQFRELSLTRKIRSTSNHAENKSAVKFRHGRKLGRASECSTYLTLNRGDGGGMRLELRTKKVLSYDCQHQ